jgi:hypothetical protein
MRPGTPASQNVRANFRFDGSLLCGAKMGLPFRRGGFFAAHKPASEDQGMSISFSLRAAPGARTDGNARRPVGGDLRDLVVWSL